MSSRIEDLTPACQALFQKFKTRLDQANIPFVVVFTLRTAEEQHALWLKGRDASGKVVDQSKVVTNCDGYKKLSNHQSGNAFDLTFANEQGKPYWPADPVRWFGLGQIAESCGLGWGGRFQPLDKNGLGWDPDHFELV